MVHLTTSDGIGLFQDENTDMPSSLPCETDICTVSCVGEIKVTPDTVHLQSHLCLFPLSWPLYNVE